LPLNLRNASFVAGFEKVLKGLLVGSIRLRLLADPDIFEVAGNCSGQRQPVVQVLIDQLNTCGLAAQNLLLAMASCCGSAGVPSDGLPNAFAALAPFEVLGALGVALSFAAYEDVIGFDAAVSRDDDGTESQTRGVLTRLLRLTSLFA